MATHGDEVYFTVNGKPATGKVLAAGKHGCTVQDGFGATRKLKHAHILGYKSRVDATAKVVDQGADGAIIEDEHGRRNYVHGYQSPPESEPITGQQQDAWGDLAKAFGTPVLMGLVARVEALEREIQSLRQSQANQARNKT